MQGEGDRRGPTLLGWTTPQLPARCLKEGLEGMALPSGLQECKFAGTHCGFPGRLYKQDPVRFLDEGGATFLLEVMEQSPLQVNSGTPSPEPSCGSQLSWFGLLGSRRWPLPGSHPFQVTNFSVAAFEDSSPHSEQSMNPSWDTTARTTQWDPRIPKPCKRCQAHIRQALVPSNSLRVLLAISLISMRGREREGMAGMGVAPLPDVGVMMTLGTRGDFRGRSMLLPTRSLRGIL